MRFNYGAAPEGPCVSGESHISSIEDSAGRRVEYDYDSLNRLQEVRQKLNAAGEFAKTTYTYDGSSNRLATIRDGRLNDPTECPPPCTSPPTLTNTYRTDGKVQSQTHADGDSFNFAYTISNGKVTQTDVTYSFTQMTRRVLFSPSGYMTQDTRSVGSEMHRLDFGRSAAGLESGNFISSTTQSVTASHDRTTTFEYYATGDLKKVIRDAGIPGTPQTLETIYTYEPRFNQLATVEDPLHHITTFTYDAADPTARLLSITDPTSRKTAVSFTPAGQLASVDEPILVGDPNPVTHRTQFTYQGGDLVGITDPNGATTKRFLDAAGRLRRLTDARGQTTQYDYDFPGHLMMVTDPLGKTTQFSYDKSGNLKTVQDARGKTTQYAYNSVNLLFTRTDPLGRRETFDPYNGFGKPIEFEDRRGKVTRFGYDFFGRLAAAQYGFIAPRTEESSTLYLYDLADRLTNIIRPGTITRSFDDADRVTSEITNAGQVTYTYDGNRRKTMAVAGQPTLCYEYDDADRLLGIREGVVRDRAR